MAAIAPRIIVFGVIGLVIYWLTSRSGEHSESSPVYLLTSERAIQVVTTGGIRDVFDVQLDGQTLVNVTSSNSERGDLYFSRPQQPYGSGGTQIDGATGFVPRSVVSFIDVAEPNQVLNIANSAINQTHQYVFQSANPLQSRSIA